MEQGEYIYFLLGFCLIIQTSGLYSKESVPILIWSNERQPLDIPAVSTVPIPFSLVEGKYLKSFNQNNVILFLQDTLSVEDLSSHEDVFEHISKYMDNGHSLYLPAVEIGTSLTHTFSSHGYNIITIEPGSAIGELKLKEGSPNLVLVKLPSTTTNPSRQKALQKTDEIIGNVISKIGKLTDFTVIYTGIEPSMKLESRGELRRTARAAIGSAERAIEPTVFQSECIILYLSNGFIVQKGNYSYVVPNNKSTDAVPDCRETEQFLIISYKDVDDYTKVKIKLSFKKVHRYWTFYAVELDQISGNNVLPLAYLYPQYPMEHVPLNKSFACAKKLAFISNTTENLGTTPEYKIIIKGIQVEAFTYYAKKFDDSWDCVGFFTIPIWMGLFAGILLTFIVLMGLCMLADIKTMDRFDDPKGKHIVLTGSNE